MDVLIGGSLIMGGVPDPLAVNRIDAKSGPLKIGSATSSHGLTATDDLLIAGKLEVDEPAFFDEGLTATESTGAPAITIPAPPASSKQAILDIINGWGGRIAQVRYGTAAGTYKWTIGMDTDSPFDYVINDQTTDIIRVVRAGDIFLKPSGMANASEIGQGDTDTDISYLALRNASGTLCYIYPDAAGTGITVSTTKP